MPEVNPNADSPEPELIAKALLHLALKPFKLCDFSWIGSE